MDRRDFFRRVGIAASSVVAFGCRGKDELDLLELEANADGTGLNPGDLDWQKAPCRFCGTGCGVEVGIHKGKAIAVRGDEASAVNRGLLCVKGYHLPKFLYGKDRLRYPLRRKDDGTYERISWDAALDLIAEKFQGHIKEDGKDSVAFYGSGQWTVFDGYAALKFMKGGIGTNNLEPNARICMASAVMGFMTQFQSDEPMGCYDDFELSDDFVLWGNNMAEMHPVLFSRILEHRSKNPGVRIIDIATRRTPTSHHADTYIEMRPGSDLTSELDAPATDCRTRFVAMWSDLDAMMVPKRNARIVHPDLNARNVFFRGVGHMSLPVDGRVVHEISTTLAHLGHDGRILTPGTTSINSSTGRTRNVPPQRANPGARAQESTLS
jgi:nitrate reductase NapA